MSSPAQQPRLWRQLRRILAYARPQRLPILIGLLVFMAANGLSLVLPLGIRTLLDTALQRSEPSLLHMLALGLLGLFLVRFALGYVGAYLLMLAGERMVLDLRKHLYRHLHSLDLRFFHDQRIGDLSSRLSSDTAAIRNAVTETLAAALLQLVQLVGALAIMLAINWRLSLLVLLAAPAATFISQTFAPRLRKIAHAVQEQLGRTLAVAQEALAGYQVVKAFARGPYETGRYGQALEKLFVTARTSARINSFFRSLIALVAAISTIALFWFGGLEVIQGRLSAGDLVAFLFYSQMITQSLTLLAQQYTEIHLILGVSRRVFEILDLEPAIRDAPDARALPTTRGHLAFEGVSFGYTPGHPVLHDIALTVEPGETVAIVGASGAGKTTLLHLVNRFFEPTAGRILLDGCDLRELKVDWLREQVAFVPQDTFLFGLTVRENIRYGRLDADDREIEEAAVTANAAEFILQLPAGYETEIGERGVKLSGGQRQRLAIARALLKDAPILVLDEATSAVDSVSERLIQEAVERMRRGRTTLIVAHRLGTVVRADRILVVVDGRIVQIGTHEEMIAREGPYQELVRSQFYTAAGTPAPVA